jgi:hypothetical protein
VLPSAFIWNCCNRDEGAYPQYGLAEAMILAFNIVMSKLNDRRAGPICRYTNAGREYPYDRADHSP